MIAAPHGEPDWGFMEGWLGLPFMSLGRSEAWQKARERLVDEAVRRVPHIMNQIEWSRHPTTFGLIPQWHMIAHLYQPAVAIEFRRLTS